MGTINRTAGRAFRRSLLLAAACIAMATPLAAQTDSWEDERAARQAAIEAYVAANNEEFLSYKNAPLAIKQGPFHLVGIPMVMFRLLPELFPDIWGEPEDMMVAAGLGPDPWAPGSVLPLGVGYLPSAGFEIPLVGKEIVFNYATLTCAACHAGAVVGPDGEVTRMLGAPTTTSTSFFGLITKTVQDPRYTASAFRTALASKPEGWVYGDPAMASQEKLERSIFERDVGSLFFVEELKAFGNAVEKKLVDVLLAHSYGLPGAPPMGQSSIPGSIDVFSALAASRIDTRHMSADEIKAAMPQLPAPSDIPSAWMQSNRAGSQWDNSIELTSFRESAASMTVAAGEPTAINLDNVALASAFVQDLPAAPYPFPIDQARATRGQALFESNCQGCHKPNNSLVWPPEVVGTDPNRAQVITDFVVTNLTEMMRQACTIPECLGPDGAPLPDVKVMKMPGGYGATALDGIWATAPYLHNGSVPTLAALLTGDRPATFYRGNTTFDQANVGFTWDKAVDPTAYLLDTSVLGYGNAGHTGPEFNGAVDWASENDQLLDLLEYLKTL